MSDQKYGDLTLDVALKMSGADETMMVQRELSSRLSAISTDQDTFREWCRRFDALYFPTTYTEGMGFDLWPDDPSLTTPGRSHVSLTGTPAVYVDVPASLQAQEPVENMMATEDSPESRSAAQALERVRNAWKTEEKWQLKRHKAATIKALYGRTASYVYLDRAAKPKAKPRASIVEVPANLWLGYRSDAYDEIEWAAHVSLLDPNECAARYSVEVGAKKDENSGIVYPWVLGVGDRMAEEPHMELSFGPAKIEVWDYWYRRVSRSGKRGEPSKMTTYNVIIAGNELIRGPIAYEEYEGVMPYVPLFNTFIPGTPYGKSELHNMEMLIREKMARVTAGAQMIANATAGNYWQITGPEVPARGSASIKPKLNETISPGPNNRIEAIQPFIIQFQLEQHLGRLDREMAVESGLNDLLLGLAPQAVLNSSKAINALIANYEARISMRRLLFYEWDRDTWDLTVKIWAKKDNRVKTLVDAGGGVLDIIPPSLSPRDEQETALRAANLVAAKLWTQARGMDAVGVDDPEQEQNIMREERTDATLWPEAVAMMAQLMQTLSAMGLQPPGRRPGAGSGSGCVGSGSAAPGARRRNFS